VCFVAEKRLRRLCDAAANLISGGNSMKNKKLWAGLLAMVLVIGAMNALWLGSREAAVDGRKNIAVTVVHKDASERVFRYQTDAEYLGQVLLEEGLIQGENGPYGLMISAADGETADWNVDQSYWALYIGSDYATTGADGIVLTDGGAYSLVYTIG
jgi:hypothetical protein